MRTTKVKVSRLKLMETVQGRLRKAENDHKRAVEKYPSLVTAWETECIAKLEKALVEAKKGKIPTIDGGYSYGLKFPGKPSKPMDGRDLCQLRKTLKTLEIGTDETILMSQEDVDLYFGPCTL